jgi:proteasome assembly chaperone (PAC2) family protein
MPARDVLQWTTDPIPALVSPVMVIALEGYFDAASVASNALRWLVNDRPIRTVATIDPDPFYDFTQQRPQVRLDDDEQRQIEWPENRIDVLSVPGARHDLVLVLGVEPHLRFRTYVDAILAVAERLACEVVVTVGGAADAVPHTRSPQVFGSTMNRALAKRLGLSRPQYQGITGVVGVLHADLDRRSWPAIAMRVPVPHYLGNAQHPAATVALLRHLEHVLGTPTNSAALRDEIDRWRLLHDNAVGGDPQAAAFVRMLEHEFDRRTEAMLPSGDDLAAQFEQFLNEQEHPPGDGS